MNIPIMSKCHNCKLQESCDSLYDIALHTPESITVIVTACRDYQHTSLKEIMERDTNAHR